MTIAFWCLLVVAVLPIVCAGIAKAGGEAYDNHNPREWLDRQEGFRKRATAAQQNSWEAFGFFTAAVFVAHASGGPSEAVDQMAMAFVVARALYILTYVAAGPCSARWSGLRASFSQSPSLFLRPSLN
ncbi:MAG: hypothetical protein RI968_339 [Pseudomonadota bacterium]